MPDYGNHFQGHGLEDRYQPTTQPNGSRPVIPRTKPISGVLKPLNTLQGRTTDTSSAVYNKSRTLRDDNGSTIRAFPQRRSTGSNSSPDPINPQSTATRVHLVRPAEQEEDAISDDDVSIIETGRQQKRQKLAHPVSPSQNFTQPTLPASVGRTVGRRTNSSQSALLAHVLDHRGTAVSTASSLAKHAPTISKAIPSLKTGCKICARTLRRPDGSRA